MACGSFHKFLKVKTAGRISIFVLFLQVFLPQTIKADEHLLPIILSDIQLLTSDFIEKIEITGCQVTINTPLGTTLPEELLASKVTFDLGQVAHIDVMPRPNPNQYDEIILFRMRQDAATSGFRLEIGDDQKSLVEKQVNFSSAILLTKRVLDFEKPISKTESQTHDLGSGFITRT